MTQLHWAESQAIHVWRAAGYTPTQICSGMQGIQEGSEMTQSIRDAAQRIAFNARQAMIDYGKAFKRDDNDGIRDSTTRACDAIDALIELAATQPTADERLYCECKTDEERADFFASGRAYETGIVAEAVAMDVARAFFAKSLVGEITYPAHMRKEGAV